MRYSLILSLLLTSWGYAATPEDPFESVNRGVFHFNQAIDNGLILPAAKAYNRAVPAPVRKAIFNMFDNLLEVPTAYNGYLQGDIHNGSKAVWRLLVNSTLGIGGMVDVASHLGVPRHRTDMGITLMLWGFRDSPYSVLPVLGPSTLSDDIGFAIDLYITPRPWFLRRHHRAWFVAPAFYFVRRADTLETQTWAQSVALDPYVQARDAYLQYRAGQLAAVHSWYKRPAGAEEQKRD